MKSQFFPNRVFWRLDLATGLSRQFKPRANDLASLGLLSCSATAGATFSFWHAWHVCNILAACSRETQPRVPASLHNLEQFFTLSHTLPLHDSQLNTGLLIAKIQVNLAWNKANKVVDKIQPYKFQTQIYLWGLLRICGLWFDDFGLIYGSIKVGFCWSSQWYVVLLLILDDLCLVVDLVGFWFTSFRDMFGMKFYVFSWICVMRNVGK